jgi:hypothetical protein
MLQNVKQELGFKWEENITICLRKVGWEFVDWMHLVPDMEYWRAIVDTVMNIRVSKKAGTLFKN